MQAWPFIVNILLVLGVFGGHQVNAQNNPAPPADLEFQHIPKGLSQNTVTSILQDNMGFLWFGTRNGLNKYDGVEFTEYDRKFNDSISVSHGHVNCIFEDSKGTLWVGTREGGLNWYHRGKDEFISVEIDSNPNLIGNTSVTAISEDQDGNFWIGTEKNGLVLFDRESKDYRVFEHRVADHNSLSGNHVQRIFQDKLGNLWVATRYHGLNLLDKEHSRFHRYSNEPNDRFSLSSDAIRDVLKSKDGNIWIATQDGLNLMYRDQFNQVRFRRFQHDITDTTSISYNVVASLEEDDYGNIWVGTENGGLSIYDPRKQVFRRYYHNPRDPSSVGNNSFWYIYKDRTGTIWLGPLNSGINKYDPSSTKFTHHRVKPYLENTLSHNNVTCFLEDEKGNLWIGTDGGGLNYFDRSNGTYKHFRHDPKNPVSLGSDAVLSLLYDQQGRLWVGTWEGGLNMLDEKSGKFSRFMHDPMDPTSISSNNIFSMIIDQKGRFWVAASRGAIELFDPDRRSFKHFKDGDFPNSSVYRIYEDTNGQIWLGSEGRGLTLFEYQDGLQANFTYFSYQQGSDFSITSTSVISIYEDSKNNLWVGTEGGGLNLFQRDQQRFLAFTKAHGLSSDVINAILEDDQGNLWISTNKGISKFNPTMGSFRNYDFADGLQADEFIRGSYLKTSKGELVFGGIQGFNIFFPTQVRDNPHAPAVYFTDFRINNQSISPSSDHSPLTANINNVDRIVLSHDQSMLSFDFVALNFVQGIKNQYQYILEGYDKEWQQVGNRRTASYTMIPPGEYVFKVKGSNNDLVWNEEGASVAILIRPPWWKTGWAYLIYTVLIVLSLIWARQLIVHRERLKSNLKLEHLELTKMQELDQIKSRFFANISHEFRTPLTLIKEPLKSMYIGEFKGNYHNQYRVMLRNTQKLLRLINQLLDLSKLGVGSLKLRASENDLIKFLKVIAESFKSQAERQFIDFKFIECSGPVSLYYDPDKLEDVLCNLLTNAFKFTPEFGSVTLMVTVTTRDDAPGEWVKITVKDSGIGIAKDQMGSIFDRFYQVNNNYHSGRKGTGIGLALTKELVDLHHGSILVSSELDLGTEFSILLPCGKEHLREEEIVPSTAVEITELGELKGLYNEEPSGSLSESSSQLPLILVVEDSDDMRAYITEHLEINHRIIEAANGKEALEIAIKEQPELIISDIRMPIMGGIELCMKIKQDERTSHIPVVLLTGRADVENEIKGLQHGADYYFTKPFNSKLLQLRINNIISSREALRNHFSSGQKLYLEPSEVDLSSADETFLKLALTCVEENISNPDFTVIEFGKAIGLSRMQLYRKLKSITGQSANEFIRTIRLKRAAQLIEQDQLTIAEVTYEVGFNDLQYFRECFKKHFSITPSKYLENRGGMPKN